MTYSVLQVRRQNFGSGGTFIKHKSTRFRKKFRKIYIKFIQKFKILSKFKKKLKFQKFSKIVIKFSKNFKFHFHA